MDIFKSVFKNEIIFCRTAVELQKECEHPQRLGSEGGRSSVGVANCGDLGHLPPCINRTLATQRTVSLRKKRALVPTAKLRPMGQIFRPWGEAGQRTALISSPIFKELISMAISSSLESLCTEVKIMVKGSCEEVYKYVGDKAYLGGCPHFSGEK